MLDELHHLVLVAEHGTFTAASRHAHLSQPALTASIQRLERWFDVRLFDRGRHGAALTAAGEALLPRARAALAAVEDGRRAIREVMELAAGEVRLGAGHTACTCLLPPLLAAFRAEHPGIRLHLREGFTADLRALVDQGELDLAILTGVGTEPWRPDRLVVVAAPGVADADAPFVAFSAPSPTRALVHRFFPDAEIAMELGSIAAIKAHVEAGVGRALISEVAVADEVARGRLIVHPHPELDLDRQLWLHHRENLPPAAAALRDRLRAGARP
ncbi:MAG: LysR family transcriptional regulator [Myxococcales bacterium]|nr:LysR family transcriptional regulator [Myxococcales bacterium]